MEHSELFPDEVERVLSARTFRTFPLDDLRPAAVLVPLLVREGEWSVLLTRRTEHLPHHKGEISFPGGAVHAEDASLAATALRENEEEVGVPVEKVQLLGRLDDFYSVHGYHVVPFVGIFPPSPRFRVNRDEIAELIEAPLADCAEPERWRRENWRHRGRVEEVFFLQVAGNEVWGLTAAILRQFMQCCGLIKI
ncbi:MAG: CoA pyrophosphatase [Desulfuromonas sp.]|nr:MAG: CoA pyrophosphatase [Desulfuromonas sp.]